MKYMKLIIAIVWVVGLANALGLGIGTKKEKQSYGPISSTYLKGAGAFNVAVGVIATIVLQLFFANTWVGPAWLFTIALIGGLINMIVGLIMVTIGVMMHT